MENSGYIEESFIAWLQPITPRSPHNTSPFLPQYIFSHPVFISPVCLWSACGIQRAQSVSPKIRTHGLCPPLNFALSLIKESEFRTLDEPATAKMCHYFKKKKKKGADYQYYTEWSGRQLHSAADCVTNHNQPKKSDSSIQFIISCSKPDQVFFQKSVLTQQNKAKENKFVYSHCVRTMLANQLQPTKVNKPRHCIETTVCTDEILIKSYLKMSQLSHLSTNHTLSQ